MHNKFIPALIGVVVIGATGALSYWQHSQDVPAPQGNNQENAAQTQHALADIATHNTASDCWAIIDGNVYDLTSWIPRHPGGEKAIEGLCGKDGSAAFNAQHGGGATQQAILVDLKIGVVRQ